jgi:hypothetical protein
MLVRWALVAALHLTSVAAHAQAECADLDRTHAAFTKLLKAHVAKGNVDYAGLGRDAGKLDAYLTSLKSVCARNYNALGDKDKLAFWLNLYNASTLKLVLTRLPFAKITELDGGKIFDKPFVEVKVGDAPATLSLNAIENERVRKSFSEPRIHFALVCAAKSCPPLRAEAYQGARLDAQLDDQLRVFLGDANKNTFDAAKKTLALSKIFEWYRSDFDAAGGIAAFVAKIYGQGAKDATVTFKDYDWALNSR